MKLAWELIKSYMANTSYSSRKVEVQEFAYWRQYLWKYSCKNMTFTIFVDINQRVVTK